MSFGFGHSLPSFTPLPLDAAIAGIYPDVWYDPSDFSTLYQDAAGTTPVTALEQPVGLMLDKSRGLVLGSELFSGGDGTDVSGWTGPTGNGSFVSSGGQFVLTAANPISTFTDRVAYKQFSGLTSGKTYVVTATLRNISATSLGCVLDISATGVGGALATVSTTSTSSTPVRLQFTSTSSSAFVRLAVSAGAGSQVACDNISVREIPGNHAFHTPGDTTTRPVVSRRINLLTKTEDFADSYWTKNAAVSVVNGSGFSTVSVPNTVGSGVNVVYKQSISTLPILFYSLKVRGPVGVSITLSDDFGNSTVAFNGDWQTISFTSSNGGGSFHQFYIRTATASQTYSFDITQASAVPADLAALPYQRVNTTTDYDTSSVYPTFLRCDGVNDSLQTNAIDFSSTDKMFVGAGVRKLSDATQIFAELSSAWSGATGTFASYCDSSGTQQYASASRGTAAPAANQVASVTSGYAAPNTSVFTSSHDIAGDLTTLRLNGAAQTSATGDKGAGNFGNHKLYLFMRAGTSLPFNGWMFGLLVKGATLSASQIALSERWLASKTKTVTL